MIAESPERDISVHAQEVVFFDFWFFYYVDNWIEIRTDSIYISIAGVTDCLPKYILIVKDHQ